MNATAVYPISEPGASPQSETSGRAVRLSPRVGSWWRALIVRAGPKAIELITTGHEFEQDSETTTEGAL